MDTNTEAIEITRQGTHEDGKFSVTFTDELVREGTYSQDAIHLESLIEQVYPGCAGGVSINYVYEYSFDILRSEP